MIPLDLTNKLALVTGVGDNVGFAWHIAKALQSAGAKLVFGVHPRLMGIVENIHNYEKIVNFIHLPLKKSITIVNSSRTTESDKNLLHRHGFCQIARLIHIRATGDGGVVGQQLQRDHMQDR